ncbi:hypothetical protein [Blattabacterium cuenoti]|uniref:hypothetical protein n=1 Tax=Blattabacterium cuenoti TaxID=1653831 RepID=UPI001EEBD93C|nr:hypothetical protein [Blattabacterium cuenoti]
MKKYPFFSVLLGGDAYIGKQFFDFIKHFSTKQIKPFGIGYNDIYYQNIPILKKYRFVFTTKHHFNKKKRKIFSIIRKKFGKNLNKYKLLGFDLTYDLLCRLTTTTDRNLFKTIEKEEFTGIVSKYHYKKISKKGGYQNKGLWIIRLLFCNYFLK